MSNIIVATFVDGCTTAVTEAIYEGDYGMILQFAGLDLPDVYTVNFGNEAVSPLAHSMIGNADGVEIPNQLLTESGHIMAWVFLHTGEDDGETEYAVTIPVLEKMDTQIDDPTPEQESALNQAIAALNAGVERAETAADSAEQIAADLGDFETAMEVVTEAKNAAAQSASDASASAGNAAQSAQNASQSESSAAASAEGAYASEEAAAQSADDAAASASAASDSATAAAASEAAARAVEESIPEDYSELSADVGDLKSQTRGHLLSSDIKTALLACFAKVAWSDGYGQDYYNALESALYPSAQIVSINAVYNQSGTVYVTDQLNSLKADLVVTATYDDGSIETISNYALSGTLVAGTSTITVTYQSLTDTFEVTVSQHIPSAYAEYGYAKYIGAAVSNTTAAVPYIIHTNEYPNLNDLTFDFELSPVAAQTSIAAAIMGGNAANSGNTDTVEFYGRTDTQRISAFTHGTALGIDSIPNMQVGSIVHVRLEPGNASPATLNADALSVDGAWTNTNTVQKAIGLFGRLHGVRGTVVPFVAIGALKLYSVADDTLVGAYYPCVRTADNVIGYYDTVSNTFCTASNADCVTIGNENCRYAVGMWGE